MLRIEPPEIDVPARDPDEDERFRAVLQLRSGADPSLLVDVADLWNAPAAVLAALGERAETDLLLALRRGARAWPPWLRRCGCRTDRGRDRRRRVDDLLVDGAALDGAGIEVLWPAELFSGEPRGAGRGEDDADTRRA